jgi:spermidine synthase
LSTRTSQLLAIQDPLWEEQMILRLLEPEGSCRNLLWERLSDGTYNKPFIVDRGRRRFLQFDLVTIQSAMNRQRPDKLILAYTRKMMAFLLFNSAPARILLLGLGGGSLAKFCYRQLPGAVITTVEVNPDVIALREAFHVPANDDRFSVVCAEAASYVARLARPKDVILVDAYDRGGVSPELDTVEFYNHAYDCLAPGGILVANLCLTERGGASAHVRKIRAVFGDHCLMLPVKQDANLIALAFKAPLPAMQWVQLEVAAAHLKQRFGLDFPKYLSRIALCWAPQSGPPMIE